MAGAALPGGVVVAPLLHRPFQQRGGAAGGDQPDDRGNGRALGIDLPLVMTALQRVLQLQPQLPLRLQRPEVEPVIPGGLAAPHELLDLGPPTAYQRDLWLWQ